MRDFVLLVHLTIGFALVALPIIISLGMKKRVTWLKPLSSITAALAWLLLLPAGSLYINFYPVTKTVIKAGAWPWAHSVFMETKEHWGLLLPIIATVAAALVFSGKAEESRKWWILLAVLSAVIAVMGRIVVMGALAQ